MAFTKLLLSLAFCIALVIGVAGCSDDPASNNNTNTSHILFVHVSPDAPAIDGIIDGTVKAANLAFGNNSAYQEVTEGSRNIVVAATGTTAPLIDLNKNMGKYLYYSLFVANNAASIEGVYVEDDVHPADAGESHLRFANMVAGAPALDLAIQGSGTGGLFTGIGFKTVTEFEHTDAGTITIKIKDPALGQGNAADVLVQEITLESEKNYTFVVTGTPGAYGHLLVAHN